MKFLSSVMSVVRRKRTHSDSKEGFDHRDAKRFCVAAGKNPKRMKSISCGSSYKVSVLWKSERKCFIRDLMVCPSLIDTTYWFLIKHYHREHQIHNSNNLMDISYEPGKPIVHFSFTTGLMSVRFSSFIQLNQFNTWIESRVRPRATGLFAQLVTSPRKTDISKKREVRIMTRDSSMVVVDEIKQRPLIYGTIQQFKSFHVRGHDIRMISRTGQELMFICGRASEFRLWAEAACLSTTRKRDFTSRFKLNKRKKDDNITNNNNNNIKKTIAGIRKTSVLYSGVL